MLMLLLRVFTRALAAVSVLLAATSAPAGHLHLVHASITNLADVFNSTSGYGDNPLSMAFDGTNAYVGGFNVTGTMAGVVKVENVVGGGVLAKTPLSATQFTSPISRGIDALAYQGGSLFMAHDSGSAASSFISRRQASDGALTWQVNSPQASRPFAMAVDPVGNAGNPGVAFLVQGSGRRRLLSLDTGATVFDGSNGGIINSTPTAFGTAWRAIAFDSSGNIAISEDSGYQYGNRVGANQWQALNGTLNATTSSVAKNVAANLVGQGIAILEGLGPSENSLLAFSGRNMTSLTDSQGGMTAVSDGNVHIRNLNGSVTDLTQIVLTGAEPINGVAQPAWTDVDANSDTRNLAVGIDGDGRTVLLVVDFLSRRLDVYIAVPEPSSVLLLAASTLLVGGFRREARRRPHEC